MNKVLVLDPVVGLLTHLTLPHLVGAQDEALRVLVHPDIIRRVNNSLSPENLSEVLGVVGYNILYSGLK